MSQPAARNAEIAAIWDANPDRLVTVSTGVIHVAKMGVAMCATRTALRAATTGATPTCRNCGATA